MILVQLMPITRSTLKQDLSRKIQDTLAQFDALIVPTSNHSYPCGNGTVTRYGLNSQFGTYTNFTNLADLSALALPAGFPHRRFTFRHQPNCTCMV